MMIKYICGCEEKTEIHKDGLEVITTIFMCKNCSTARDRFRAKVSVTTIYFQERDILEVKHARVAQR